MSHLSKADRDEIARRYKAGELPRNIIEADAISTNTTRNWPFVPQLPPEATDLAPGSAGKVELIAQRVLDGYHPHHPDDLQIESPDKRWEDLWPRESRDMTPWGEVRRQEMSE